jgi:glutamyl-tRNA reductase
MKINPDETLESWASRVEMFEKGRAMQRIAKGDDPIKVVEDMSRRIIDKMLYPILKSFEQPKMSNAAVNESRKKYEEIMKNVARAPDHVDTGT